uniref:Uncharacterized protein n=1 Tax=Rhizophora mucronata TaxID=61149 RepID=A0A2P2LU91_RHIMU
MEIENYVVFVIDQLFLILCHFLT